MPKNDLLLTACRREPTPRTPVWIMRQAGRYLPQYRAVRARTDFLSLCKSPELAAEVTLQPVELLGVDAAIIFSDILLPAEAMGLSLSLDDAGPHFADPIRSAADVARLAIPDPERELRFVGEALRLTKRELAERVPLIGFTGAPFTLAAYMIEGGSTKNFLRTKRFLYEEPRLAEQLFEKLTQTLALSLRAQIRAGADLVQVFDSWGGELSPADFERWSLPYLSRLVEAAHAEGAPAILFATGASTLLERLARTGADVVGLDWRIEPDVARARLGAGVGIQGNLDPCALFLPDDELEARILDTLRRAGPVGHIFNLGHGILPPTQPEKARFMVERVHALSERLRAERGATP